MTQEEALALVNELFGLDMVPTVNGREFKFWGYCEGGRSSGYLGPDDCARVAAAFVALGASLSNSTGEEKSNG